MTYRHENIWMNYLVTGPRKLKIADSIYEKSRGSAIDNISNRSTSNNCLRDSVPVDVHFVNVRVNETFRHWRFRKANERIRRR